MKGRTRIVGIGQEVAGDDAVGLAILDELARRTIPRSVELVRIAHALELVSLLEAEERVVLVDAALASPAGEVVELGLEELSIRAAQPASSHGFGVRQAVELARVLSTDGNEPTLRIVAVTIARPERYAAELSPAVSRAVPRAADHVIALLGGEHARVCSSQTNP
jgi:hydrogenase maturation protease